MYRTSIRDWPALAECSATNDLQIYCVGNDGVLYYSTYSDLTACLGWLLVKTASPQGEAFTEVSISGDGSRVFAVDSQSWFWHADITGSVYTAGNSLAWTGEPTSFREIASTFDGSQLWSCESAFYVPNVWHWIDGVGSSNAIGGGISKITVNGSGSRAWGTNDVGNLYVAANHQGGHNTGDFWLNTGQPTALSHISVDRTYPNAGSESSESLWATTASGQIWYKANSASGWQVQSGALLQITNVGGSLIGLNSIRDLWYLPAYGGTFELIYSL